MLVARVIAYPYYRLGMLMRMYDAIPGVRCVGSISALARTDLGTDANLGSDPGSLPPCSMLPNHVGRSEKRFLAIVSSSTWLEALDGQAVQQSGSSDGLEQTPRRRTQSTLA